MATRIRLKEAIAGESDPANGLNADFSFRAGRVIELTSDTLATKWINARIAEGTTDPISPPIGWD